MKKRNYFTLVKEEESKERGIIHTADTASVKKQKSPQPSKNLNNNEDKLRNANTESKQEHIIVPVDAGPAGDPSSPSDTPTVCLESFPDEGSLGWPYTELNLSEQEEGEEEDEVIYIPVLLGPNVQTPPPL